MVKGLWLTITDATFVVTRCKYTIKIHFLTLFLVTNSFCFISFLLICFNMWVNVAFGTKKSAASRDAAPSKYQNNVSNTNYYIFVTILLLPSRILNEFRILIQYSLRIWEESALLLPTYLKACILSLVSVNNVEAAVGLRTMLPNNILVT